MLRRKIIIISVNKIFDLLVENWGESLAKKWLKDNSIQREDYRNGQLNGNACKKLLEKLENLRSQVPRRLGKYIEALSLFNDVRKSCFGQDLLPSFKLDIERFKKAYERLGVPFTNKVHVLVEHVPEFCDQTKRGLGFYSEQAR